MTIKFKLMNLNETLNSDYKKNELLDDDEYEIDEEQPMKGDDEESKYGMVVSVANEYRSKQV